MTLKHTYLKCIGAVGIATSVTQPSLATSAIVCYSTEPDAEIRILLGAGPILNVYTVSINSGGKSYDTEAGSDEKLILAQAHFDDSQFRLVFMDSDALTNTATVHVVRHSPPDAEPLQVGYARVGKQAFTIRCDGP